MDTVRMSCVADAMNRPDTRTRTENGAVPRILVVEDELELSTLLQTILVGEGYQVEQAYSLSDALHSLDEEAFDAAVLDVELRDGLVFSVADRLKARGIPFFFLSAVYRGVVPVAHRDVPFLGKPYELDELKGYLAESLRSAS